MGGMDPYDGPLRSPIVVPISHSLLRTSQPEYPKTLRSESLAPGAPEPHKPQTQRLQYPLIKEHTLKYNGNPNKILGLFLN